MWVPAKAKVSYDPYRPGLRKVRPGSLIVADLDFGTAAYYRWWIKKRFGLELQPTAFMPHITILDGKVKLDDNKFKTLWKKYQNKLIDFEYSVEVEQHWKFWVLPVRGKTLEGIRAEFGLNPNYKFHITIGRML